MKRKQWYRLDNAAKIFPSVVSDRTTTVFRLAVTLNKLVDPHYLKLAANNIISRFPYYQVKVKYGLFWHYLEHNDNEIIIFPETSDPCRKIIYKKNNDFLFRIVYYRKRVSLEMSHILTDGTGGLIFLNSIIAEYFNLKKIKIDKHPMIFTKKQKIRDEESTDSYLSNYRPGVPMPYKKESAFHINEKLLDKSMHNIITGVIKTKDLLSLAKSHNASLTEYMVALYLNSLLDYISTKPLSKRKKLLKPVRIMVPVNLRKIFSSITMRNFFLLVMPGVDPRLGKYEFSEILKIVHHSMRMTIDDKFIGQQISRNVGLGEKNWFVRLLPLFTKIPIEKTVYNMLSAREHSGVMTNLGAVDIPENMKELIERYEFIPNPNPVTKKNIALISFKENIYITFGSLTDNTEIETIFFRKLRKSGIKVKIEANIPE